ncbi:MAG: carbohydrate-binding domain-containing protein [Clostridia bacterium]|nr:carbohydrate-binding domain-containing protein [Clostridia bacterium]
MKNARKFTAAVIAVLMIALCSCGGNAGTSVTTGEKVGNTDAEPVSATAELLSDPADDSKTPSGDFEMTTEDGSFTNEGNVYTVTAAGKYTLSGSLPEGQIVVDAGEDDEITLVMSGASVTCSTDAPVKVVSAGEVKAKAADGSYNVVTDARTGSPESASESDDNPDAAIWADCDLKLDGEGTLIVSSTYDNGVKSKDDLKIKEITLKVTAPGNALKGNDSVTVESGALTLISTASDGIKTSNTDVSKKGKQKGTVSIQGGQVDVYSFCDGISAAYNAEISGEAVLNVFTSSYAGEAAESGDEVYLIVPKSVYSQSDGYYAYLYNDDDGAGVWIGFEYETMVYSGRTASYYGLKAILPAGYSNVIFAITDSGAEPSAENCRAATSGGAVNRGMNSFLISSVSDGSVTGDWTQLSSGSGSSEKTTYSSKGIKAYNEVIITGGAVTVYAKDDGIHANADGKLENGERALGNITVSGGSVTITSADDGMHADGALIISGGTVNVAESHEGLEANVITVSGGTTFVYGNDDGINATKGASTPLVNITGGYLDVTTPSGDTDGIDSNGNITMSGGFVIVKGGSSSGMVAGSVDVDGTITVTGGTIIALGGICETPASGSVNVYASSGTSFREGDYELTDSSGNTIASFTLKSSYSSFWIASEELGLNGSYTLTSPSGSVASWTQTSSSVGTSGMGGGGFGGGGFGGGGRPGGRR